MDVPEVRPLQVADPLEDETLFRELTYRFLIWDPFVSGSRRVDLHPLILPRGLHDTARRAAEATVRSIARVARLAHEEPEEARVYALHPDVSALAAASHRAGDTAALVRVDLLLGDDGAFHPCEVNADCPGGFNEAFGLPRLARSAGFLGGENPTVVVDHLARRLVALARGGTVGLVFATAYAEDLQVCAFIKRRVEALGARAIFVSPTAPRASPDGALRVRGGERIDVLYRFYPIEEMAAQGNVRDYVRAVESGKLRTLSSFAQVYGQSKLSFARAWTRDPEAAREARIPATFAFGDIEVERIIDERAAWVVKRAFGRVGDEVLVGALASADEWAGLVREVARLVRRGDSWIAQRFIPQRTISTVWGPRYVTLGAYVLDGTFAGYFVRLTPESHVSHDALVVPAFVEGAPS
ncbi:glutathionylspermidine synthase family protein [Pendulispora albinea]|uniref:Glutathionylspermidine synthase family protein n=1 Tax=Pendulispora albinea TaxID=2741071 RepID=A0ABZ2MCS0_9BACT